MSEEICIRAENTNDEKAITDLTIAAFKTLEISNQTEHLIIEALRKANVLTLSLVADRDDCIVGHIAFSPVTISDGTTGWFTLAPVSVAPPLHKQGIGSALIKEGLTQLKGKGTKGCCVVGHPEYYNRFGFINPDNLGVNNVPKEAFFSQKFEGNEPEGLVSFHESFSIDGF